MKKQYASMKNDNDMVVISPARFWNRENYKDIEIKVLYESLGFVDCAMDVIYSMYVSLMKNSFKFQNCV